VRVTLRGGRFDGETFAMFGKLPSYLMVMEHPTETYPLVVGADFDDHWPEQVRYDRQETGIEGPAVYQASGNI
jgi:hypothetical protein